MRSPSDPAMGERSDQVTSEPRTFRPGQPPACPGDPAPGGSDGTDKPGNDVPGMHNSAQSGGALPAASREKIIAVHMPPNPPTGTRWVRVGNLEDIPRLGSRVVQTRDADIAVFRTADDRVFALLDRCPHKSGKLSQGIVHGTSVTCPLHNWVIGLADGLAKDPDTGCVVTVPAQIDGADIFLAIGS
jgi:nitrite reductase (NADH) small subunit